MSVRRVMGIETEYGILGTGEIVPNPMLLSAQVVTAYAASGAAGRARARWDYQDEDPLNDARGWRLDRGDAHPSQLTDVPEAPAPDGDWEVTERRRPTVVSERTPEPSTVSNVLLPNGARYYVDHAHPEYSGPEVMSPRDAVLWDRAGDEILLRSSRLVAQTPGLPDVALYKNNVDGKGASYGTHENYLVRRDVPFADVVAMLTPFLVTRPVFAGSGRVGIGQRGERAGFQLSQRADYVEAEVGLETTLRRPIINTRDEPHADERIWRRLHVIVGDANLLDVATYLKVGTTALVLWLLESDGVPPAIADLALADPVAATQQVSHDLTLTRPLDLADGGTATALEIQTAYADAVAAARDAHGTVDDETTDVLRRWRDLLERLRTDRDGCSREVEWVAKLRVLEGMRRRDQIGWDHPRLAALDLQWSDLRPERSVFHRLAAAGAVEQLVATEEVERAIAHPPSETRAFFRGECLRRYPDAVTAASWDAVVFDLPGERNLRRVPMPDPHRGTAAHVGALLDAHPDAGSLLAALVAPAT